MSHLSCQNPGQNKHVKSKLREAFSPSAASGRSQLKLGVMRHREIEKKEKNGIKQNGKVRREMKLKTDGIG